MSFLFATPPHGRGLRNASSSPLSTFKTPRCSLSSSKQEGPLFYDVKERPSRLLTFADHAIAGPLQEHPRAAEANRITKELFQRHGIHHSTFDEYKNMTGFFFPWTSMDRLVCIDLCFCMLVFMDDVYDRTASHEYSNSPEGLLSLAERVCRIVCDGYQPEDDHVLFSLCTEIHAHLRLFSNPTWLRRFSSKFFAHVMDAVRDRNKEAGDIDFQSYAKLRTEDSGMRPAIDFIEIAFDICLPDEVLEHETVKELVKLTSRIGWLSNDVFSYEKEVLRAGGRFNGIFVLMEQHNMSLEEAVHECIAMVNRDTERFAQLEQALPTFESREDDLNLRSYVQGLRDIIIGTYHWQMSTNRYRSQRSPFPELRQFV